MTVLALAVILFTLPDRSSPGPATPMEMRCAPDAAGALGAAVRGGVLVRVRPWRMSGAFSPAQLDAVLEQAARVWRPYGIAVAGTRGAAAERSGVHLQLVVDEAPPDRAGRLGGPTMLASIDFLAPGTPRAVIHVSLGGARRLLQDARVRERPLAEMPQWLQSRFLVQALGRAIAHEIGHFLLASPGHSRWGLMRATFSTADLLSPRLDTFRLSAAQGRLVTAAATAARCGAE